MIKGKHPCVCSGSAWRGLQPLAGRCAAGCRQGGCLGLLCHRGTTTAPGAGVPGCGYQSFALASHPSAALLAEQAAARAINLIWTSFRGLF